MDIAFELSRFIAMLIIACVGIDIKSSTQELVFLLILPPLLFEGALNMDIEHLKENLCFRRSSKISFPKTLEFRMK